MVQSPIGHVFSGCISIFGRTLRVGKFVGQRLYIQVTH